MSENTDEVVAGIEAEGAGQSSAARGKAPNASKRPVKSRGKVVDEKMPSGIVRRNW